MSQTVDRRVVEMQFNNKDFESGVATTMTTLQKLKKSLDFSKIGESFEKIGKASDKADLSGLDRAISGIHSKFSALEVVAITTLSNITNSIVNSAKRWASAFTIAPIKTGFQEYETQINAVQTILANTEKEGASLQDVNAALDELNLYADKTIYNFTEMTRNIGRFTAAGVDLKTSTSAIQGIANLAAVSGSNSQQASIAMYQLSQALSSGTIRLMDWNSVVNAGMGGQLFQDALKETSKLLGTGAEAAIKAEGSFRESLKSGWLTAEVLTETLKKFTTSGAVEYVANYTELSKEAIESELELAKSIYGEADAIDKASESLANKSGKNKDEIEEILRFAQNAEDAATKVKTFTQLIDTLKEALQSGWSQSFRIIVGDFEEARTLFTEISDSFGAVISASADARNKLLSEVFNKKDAKDYISSVTGASKEAVSELQTIAKESEITSDTFKEALNSFTNGDESLNKIVTNLIGMVKSEKDVITYISEITGMNEGSIANLQSIGKEVGYTSEEFKNLAKVLSEGDPEMEKTISYLLQMNDAVQKPSGRELLIDSLRNSIKGLLSVVKPVKEAFREVFPPKTAEEIYGLLDAIHEFTKALTISEKNSESLKKAFKGVFDIAKLLGDSFLSLLKLMMPIEKPISSMAEGLLNLAASVGESLSSFSSWARSSPDIAKAYNIVGDSFEIVALKLHNFIEKIKSFDVIEKVSNSLKNALGKFGSIAEKVEIRFTPVTNVFDFFLGIIEKAGPTVIGIINKIGDAFSSLSGAISKMLGGNSFDSVYDLFNAIVAGGMGVELLRFIKNVNKTTFSLANYVEGMTNTNSSAGGIFDSIKKAISGVTDTFSNLQTTLQSKTLKEIAVAIALIAGSILVISLVDSEKLSSSLGAISVLIGELTGILVLLSKINASKKGAIKGIKSLVSMSVSILILSAALKSISGVDSDKLGLALKSITVLLAEMTGVALVISNYGGKIKTGVAGILAFSASIYILTFSVKKLGELDAEVLKKGLISIGALLAELGAFMVAAKFGKFKPSQAVGILILSGTLMVLQKAVEKFSVMEPDKLLVGLVAIGAILTELSAFSLAAGESKHILSTSVSLVIMAKALEMLAVPMTAFGAMDSSQIGRGLLAIGVALAEITIAMRLMPKNVLIIGAGLAAVAYSLVTIGDLIVKIGDTPWENIANGLKFLGASMAILAVAMNAMRGTLGASAAMLVMSTSLAIFVPVFKSLASISWTEVAKGLITLAAAFAVMGVAGTVLSPVIPAMIGLASAMLVLSGAAALVGVGVLALATGLTALAGSGIAGAAALVEVTKILIVGFLNAITESVSALEQALKTLITAACSVIIECIPLIMETVLTVVKEVLASLVNNAPVIVNQLLQLIISLIDALAKDLPTVIQSVVNLFMQFFAGIIQALKGIDSNVLLEGLAGIGVISAIMAALAGLSTLALPAMQGVLAMGVVVAELAVLLAAIGALNQIPGLSWLIGEGGELLKGIGTAIGGFIGGIIGGVLNGVSSQLPQIGSDLSIFMNNLQPFIAGSKNMDSSALDSVKMLSGIIIALTVAEIINGIGKIFDLSLADLAVELSDFMVALIPFIHHSKNIKEENMKACTYLGDMLLSITKSQVISGIARVFGLSGSLSDFGEELQAFGPSIAAFARQVKDVKPEAVQGAASAAEIMASMADKLPANDGLLQKIFGSKSLSDFGYQLVTFGPYIASFADMVKDVKPEAVQGAAAAGEIMASLADKLPSSDSLWDSIFGGGQVSLSEFGGELIKFAESMVDFSESLTGMNVWLVDGAVTAFTKIVDLANYVQGTSAETLIAFSEDLSEISADSVNNFIASFANETPNAVEAVTTLCNAVSNTLVSEGITIQARAIVVGNNLVIGIRTGISQKQALLTLAETELGKNIPKWLSDGINQNREAPRFAISRVCSTVINMFQSNLSESTFRGIGANAALGLKYGIESKINEVADAAIRAARAAVDAARRELDEHSPSKVAAKIGEFFSLGVAGGIVNQIKAIALAGAKAADEAVEPVKMAVDGISSIIDSGNFDMDPVIRPVVDLTDIQQGARDISELMNRKYDLSSVYDKALDTSSSFIKTKKSMPEEEATTKTDNGNKYEFNQYNYSPKSLSRSEIYRQTNNQFSAFKRTVNQA